MKGLTIMAENNDLNKEIESRMTGTPQTKPDERRQYLGSLRERVLVRATVQQIAQPQTLAAFKQAAPQFKPAKLLLNGKLDPAQLKPYLQYANQHGFAFTMVNNDTAHTTPEATGLLLVAAQAVNQDNIDISQYEHEAATADKPKKSLLDELFHRN
ncbi:hypothetical protein FC24_GL000511 [Loigolactobacillus rennini DSM 20253]|uniref:DUF1694 domain-containing protein n=2 Tax=Loigolactobacillus rennini TaxID=238013 RepID=A0A0R2D7T2_9LACO|nr:hypothetical protein FC24_GL000511 [Loigolactobacillus rennini DSM 20253]